MNEHDVAVRLESRRDWERARQKAFFENLFGALAGDSPSLLSFEEVRKSLRLSQKNYKGLIEIPLKQIRGSVGRYRDFTKTFLPRKDSLRHRWERVNSVVIARGLEPIEVYQVGDAYFVVDGNHRVSVALNEKMNTILAHVTEFSTPVGLSAEADLDELLIKAEYAEFLEVTGLGKSRPDQKIEFTTPGRYRELEYQIALYRLALEKIDDRPISPEEASAAWYEMIYTPATQMIRQSGIMADFPNRTEADLFAWIWRNHHDLPPNQRKGTLANTIAELSKEARRNPLAKLLFRFRARKDGGGI